MSSPPSDKRRRGDDHPSGTRQIERDAFEIRSSLQELYSNIETRCDVIVVVQGASSSREFPCVSALLASASRPLAVMLYGPMRAATLARSPQEKQRLHLSMTEPWCFELLLQYIHGIRVALCVENAVQLHHVADFYEVLQLRDACCNFLLETLRSDNCCELLRRSQEVPFDLLLHRCKDFLTFEFTSVVENDPGFPSLEHRILGEVLRRRDLVCREELQVLQAIVQWYTRQPSADKYEQLRELLPLVRWSLLPSDAKRSEEVHLLISQLLPNLQPPESTRPSKRARKAAATPVSNPDLATAGDVQLLASSLYANASSGDKPSEPERQLKWGLLVEQSEAREDAAQNSPADKTEYVLECTKQYMVGRSRRCDIRIGHKAPTPYISSQHFKVYHTIRWPTLQVNHSPPLPIERPSLEARLEDLSQNGTYVNGKQVERGKNVVLAHGDKIELVFSHWHVPAPSNAKIFPCFTFESWRSSDTDSSRAAAGGETNASPSTLAGQATQTRPEVMKGVRRMLPRRN